MKYLLKTLFILLSVALSFSLTLAQTDNYCLPGQTPQFIFGFAFLKGQLDDLMGEPVECEHYDQAGNAFQKTTTGQAFYAKESNTPMFSSGNQHWTWTPEGLKQRLDNAETGAVEATATPTALTAAPQEIRVMSYNVLYGAGATPYWENIAANQKPFSNPGNRLPAVLEVIKAAEPDIVGIQEAAGWNTGRPQIVQQVADELGMQHVLVTSPSGLNLALFSKFEIVEAENLTEQIGNIGALRATLSVDGSSQLLYVFVVHLDPFSTATRIEQLSRLSQLMAPHHEAPTILMGDTNIECANTPARCPEYQVLAQVGWQLVMKEQYVINQIWTSPLLAEPVTEITFPGANFKISDHLPVGAVLEAP